MGGKEWGEGMKPEERKYMNDPIGPVLTPEEQAEANRPRTCNVCNARSAQSGSTSCTECEMVKCPDCRGTGRRRADFARLSDGKCVRGVNVECSRCRGEGRIRQVALDWLARGELMRKRRIASKMSLRAEAERLGIMPKMLSDMENGRIEPMVYP